MSSLDIHIYNASYVNTDTFFESFSIQSKTKEFSLICAILRFKFILRSFPKRRRSRPFHENKIEIQRFEERNCIRRTKKYDTVIFYKSLRARK